MLRCVALCRESHAGRGCYLSGVVLRCLCMQSMSPFYEAVMIWQGYLIVSVIPRPRPLLPRPLIDQ